LSCNPDSEETFINGIIVARAFEQNCAVVFCDSGGDGEEYFGASQVALPFKGGVGRLDGKEQVRVIEMDLNGILEDAEVWNFREDVTRPGWYKAENR
jgi:predicted amidohydrolase